MRTPLHQPIETARDKAELSRDTGQLCQSFYTRYVKRVFDILLSILGLIGLFPVLVVVACCIKLTSRGPIIFRQTRVGKDNREFEVLKFRSMVRDAAANGLRITISGDRRLTRIGKLLRRYKIDELPQLWNVLRGEMSFVGPRPELPHYVAGYSPEERVVLSARPGITDPSTLAYLNEEQILASQDDPENVYRTQILPDKLARSIAYLRRVSVASDLRIIIQTVAQVVRPASQRAVPEFSALGKEPEFFSSQGSAQIPLHASSGSKAGPRVLVREYLGRLPQMFFNRRPVFIYFFQAMLVAVSLVLGWLLRFDFSLPYGQILFTSGVLLVTVRLITLHLFKLDHGWWHFASVNDALNILKSVATGSAVFLVCNHYLLGMTAFPRSIYLLEAVLTASLLAGTRLTSRVLTESVRRDSSRCKRVILVGAGFAAQMVIRELARRDSGYAVIGCVDDDLSKVGMRLHGVPVLGTIRDLQTVIPLHEVDEILIAIPSASGQQMRRITEVCQKVQRPFKTVPTLRDIISGQASVNQFREVRLEDLLGREPVQIDLEAVRREIAGRRVVVTGAAGSIGSELCRQILDYAPARLICLDQSETGLYFLRLELKDHQNGAQLAFCVADICDAERVGRLLVEFRPEIVFHAAAYKHVPMMESNVQEAVKNNVLALMGLLDMAEEAGCKNFVLISSDKAVNPTNVMGATKRIGELIVSSRPVDGMRCVSVRFGNVLGSSGSVIPTLEQQLRQRQPLTITHPDVKRFFMITPEAVALVLQAFAIGNHGDILVLDMGESVRILDLARSLIRLSGKSEQDVEIKFTGLREGEKLEEELFYEHEEVSATPCHKIKRTNGSLRDWQVLCCQLDELRASLTIDGTGPIRTKIKEIVPEYSFGIGSRPPSASGTGGGKFRAVAGQD